MARLVRVFIDSVAEGHIKRILVLSRILSACRDVVDNGERNGVNTTLKGSKDLCNWLSERGQTKQTVLANDSAKELLVNLNKSSE